MQEDTLIKIEIKEVSFSDEELLKEAAKLVSEYSWGKDYPLQPIDEIRAAEYRVGVFQQGRLVGFGSVGRAFSPDDVDDNELWLAHVVVVPEFRGKGIFGKIYNLQLAYAQSQTGRILSCTDNPIMEKFFLKNGWKKIRQTVDGAGLPSAVFEYER